MTDVWIISAWIEITGEGGVLGASLTRADAMSLAAQCANDHGQTVRWDEPANDRKIIGWLSKRSADWTGPILWDDFFMLERVEVDAPIHHRRGTA